MACSSLEISPSPPPLLTSTFQGCFPLFVPSFVFLVGRLFSEDFYFVVSCMRVVFREVERVDWFGDWSCSSGVFGC